MCVELFLKQTCLWLSTCEKPALGEGDITSEGRLSEFENTSIILKDLCS